jgi:hypothetical protein
MGGSKSPPRPVIYWLDTSYYRLLRVSNIYYELEACTISVSSVRRRVYYEFVAYGGMHA